MEASLSEMLGKMSPDPLMGFLVTGGYIRSRIPGTTNFNDRAMESQLVPGTHTKKTGGLPLCVWPADLLCVKHWAGYSTNILIQAPVTCV